ncbi:MAG: hypothetical protein CMK00_02535 [Planctomycetes bacterium]|jgi:biotin carboxyl carrier protein|nr:hypothetical protein [Planctomycetota bacterium]HJO26475.1 biotin/lipoyl-containing protein [Planctomycetota bacterium]
MSRSALQSSIELLFERSADGECAQLLSPDVGHFTHAADSGRVLTSGESVGTLLSLGQARTLVVPPGVCGAVRSQRPELLHAPVERGELLYEIAPVEGATEQHASSTETASDGATGLVFRAPQSGRFYQRSAPDAPTLISPGQIITAGTVVGLIEVMKTFAQVVYMASDGLPHKARVLEVLVPDGADMERGDALIRLEPS